MTPTLDHVMIMDDVQDETTLHTPHVLPYYDLTNCTFKEESTALGDDVIASQDDSDNDLEGCTFKGRSTSTNRLVSGGDSNDQSTNIAGNINVHHGNGDIDIGDVKMKEEIVMDAVKPRPPSLILSKSQPSLSTCFKQIVDETLCDEATSQSSQGQNVKTLIVKPLPKLTRILPMIPVTLPKRIVKFETTPKILRVHLNETSQRILLPKSKSLEEKSISVRDKLKAAILKSVSGGDTLQQADKQSKPVINEKKKMKKDVGDVTVDKMKVSRNRAAAKRYRFVCVDTKKNHSAI